LGFQRGDVVNGNGKFGIISLICEEWGYFCQGVRGVIVYEFSKQKEGSSVVLLVVNENSQILFQYLVDAFSLTICLQMVGC
jgi:hypothetical protein